MTSREARFDRTWKKIAANIVTCNNCGYSFAPIVYAPISKPASSTCGCGAEIILPPYRIFYINMQTGFSRRCGPAPRLHFSRQSERRSGNKSKVTQAFPEVQRIRGSQHVNPPPSPSHMGLQGEVKESGRPPSIQ